MIYRCNLGFQREWEMQNETDIPVCLIQLFNSSFLLTYKVVAK